MVENGVEGYFKRQVILRMIQERGDKHSHGIYTWRKVGID